MRVNFPSQWGLVGLSYWLVFSVVLGYFVYHTVGGENGLLSYFRTKALITDKTEELGLLRNKCDALARNVKLMSSGSLDLDLLEERCMVVLNYCYPGDVVVR
ncbi:MAG: septum formation initiator family protein [Holosporales bacterium]|jgi:cell division protein FtsB|nr:septum formation initiator family protein [Holosporales bacterium]